MRRIAIINQKGGVGKTTTAVNFGAALARLGRRVVVIDMDPQANASQNLNAELHADEPSTYSILTQGGRVADTLRGTSTPGLSVLPAHLDLSGAELELASAIGRETILKDALDEWEREEVERTGRAPADVVLIDNPPSLGLLSVNGLTASGEVLIAVQTEFFALQGLSKLVEIVQLLRRRMKPDLEITGVLACLYDSRLRLAREVLAELRTHFPEQLYKRAIATNVKLAETPSFSRTIFEYAPESKGAEDYLAVAREFLEREGVDADDDLRSVEAPLAARPDGPLPDALASFELVPQAAPPVEEVDGGAEPVEGPEPEPATEPEVAEEGADEVELEEIEITTPVVESPRAAGLSFGAGLEVLEPTETRTVVVEPPAPRPVPILDADLEPDVAPEAESRPAPEPEPLPEPEPEPIPAPRRAAPLAHRGEERAQVPGRGGPLANDRA